MRDAFKQHEVNFEEWCSNDYPLPFNDKEKERKARRFLEYIDSESFKRSSRFDLWRHQQESIKRSIYAFEVLKKKDLLLNIVTGGGKTVIIAGIIAYLRIVHDFNKFLILVPNTVVRQRLVDDFNPKSDEFVYNVFNFFFNSYDYLKDRFSLHIMKQGESPTGIRTSNIILGNIHQIYEGQTNLEMLLDDRNVDRIAIFNDEAHNTKAKQYNLLLNRLKPKRFIRVDTTATPERLDGLHPDSEMIYKYGIRKAMRDKVVKRIVVFKPDIETVKLQWKDEDGKVYSVDEVPWDQIEKGWVERNYDGKRVKVPAVKYVTDSRPATQQLQIYIQCIEYQKKGVPKDTDGKPKYKPLLFIVTFSISDAKQVAQILRGNPFNKEVLVVHNESPEEHKEEVMKLNQDMKNVPYDAVVSVMMLREGWDVKNISVICLFRKFSYKEVGGRKMSVYGPQVIGRGLRRIIHSKDRWESLFVVDHPILKHNWLWDQLDADIYEEPLDPGDVIDERKMPKEPEEQTELREDDADELKEKIDWDKLAQGIPEFKDGRKPITDWQEFLDNYEYILEGVSISETVKQIKSRNLDSGMNTLDREEVPDINIEDINIEKEHSAEELRKLILKQMSSVARDALVEYDGNPDSRQTIIYDILSNHLKKRFLLGSEVKECTNKQLLSLVWEAWSQIREVFLKPELIEGILKNK